MKLSTNSVKSLREYDALPGKLGTKLKSNASPDDDAAFIQELRRTDPARYNNLVANIQKAACAAQRAAAAPATRFCDNEAGGKHVLPENTRKNAKYCDRACQNAAYRNRKAKAA